MVDNAYTQLVLSGDGVQPYATRGASQSLDPIQEATQVARTVNGKLVNLSFDDGFKKFASTISCNDQTSPAFERSWPGLVISVSCISELCYKTSGGSPSRPVVEGSSRVEGDYTFYRPLLSMMVLRYNLTTDEYGRAVSWSMQLEEI